MSGGSRFVRGKRKGIIYQHNSFVQHYKLTQRLKIKHGHTTEMSFFYLIGPFRGHIQ